MATNPNKYSVLAYDTDLESDNSSEHSPEKGLLSGQTTTRPHVGNICWTTWIRWSVVVGLQTIILALLLLRTGSSTPKSAKVVETGSDINGLYQTLSHEYRYLKLEPELYMPNMSTINGRMETRKMWDKLMPLGSGSVSIPDYKDHPLLGQPISDDPIRSGPLFEASWTHALHCLYYSVDSYHQLIVNGRTDDDNPVHAAHCFEYLRNNILCSLDMTLEGSQSTIADKSRGQAHVCRNREEAVKWIEERRVDDLQDIVGP
jgi:hypothetical protein